LAIQKSVTKQIMGGSCGQLMKCGDERPAATSDPKPAVEAAKSASNSGPRLVKGRTLTPENEG
jgi:hypothetical protein